MLISNKINYYTLKLQQFNKYLASPVGNILIATGIS